MKQQERLLIDKVYINDHCRPCNADDLIVERCIVEAQQIDLTRNIGAALVAKLITERSTRMDTLLDGGTYEDCCGNSVTFQGIRTALAYYAYSRIIGSATGMSTRFGFVTKNEQYSLPSDLRDRNAAKDEARATADFYMGEVVAYLQSDCGGIYPEYNGGRVRNGGGTTFKVIGD